MILLRRFLVIQALMLWQGGFLFYTAIVVPIGTREFGAFEQGRITRQATHAMNLIGAVSLAILAWDQFANSGWKSMPNRWRWTLWAFLLVTVVALSWLHSRVDAEIDFASGQIANYGQFYMLHRVYLYIATAQWIMGLAYVILTLWAWRPTTKPS